MLERLIEAGLMFGNLIEVSSPTMVARYNAALEKLIDGIIAANPDKVADARANPKAIGWFVGQAMKASGGKANPQAVNDLLRNRIGI